MDTAKSEKLISAISSLLSKEALAQRGASPGSAYQGGASQGLRAIDITRQVNKMMGSSASGTQYTTSQINRCLYHNPDRFARVDGTPPLWSLVKDSTVEAKSKEQVPEEPASACIPTVLVDLGNVHDVMTNARPYAESGSVRVVGFADLNSACFPCTLPQPIPCLPVVRAEAENKNAADMEMTWFVANHLCTSPPSPPQTFIICSKDKGLSYLKTLILRHNPAHEVCLCRGWEDARLYIEA